LEGVGLIGVSTSRKIGNRPARNRVRRRFQAALRLKSECIERRLDYVVIIGAAGKDAPMPEVAMELEELLKDLRARWAKEWECS
jgi:ribonuclease P protein component